MISKEPQSLEVNLGPCIDYMHMGPWQLFVGFTLSEEAYLKEIRRLNVADPGPWIGAGGNNHASATTHQITYKGNLTCIICMQDDLKHDIAQVAALLAHEAVHVAQGLWRHCGETHPGEEAEAYLVQYVTQVCLNIVIAARKSKRKRKAKP